MTRHNITFQLPPCPVHQVIIVIVTTYTTHTEDMEINQIVRLTLSHLIWVRIRVGPSHCQVNWLNNCQAERNSVRHTACDRVNKWSPYLSTRHSVSSPTRTCFNYFARSFASLSICLCNAINCREGGRRKSFYLLATGLRKKYVAGTSFSGLWLAPNPLFVARRVQLSRWWLWLSICPRLELAFIVNSASNWSVREKAKSCNTQIVEDEDGKHLHFTFGRAGEERRQRVLFWKSDQEWNFIWSLIWTIFLAGQMKWIRAININIKCRVFLLFMENHQATALTAIISRYCLVVGVYWICRAKSGQSSASESATAGNDCFSSC